MDYLKFGRAADIQDPRARKIFRFFEILPGALSWLTLFLAFLFSWLAPAIVFYFLVIFIVFFLSRSLYFAYHLKAGFEKMQSFKNIDWLEKLKQLSFKDYSLPINNWEDIYHLVILPNYKEPAVIIKETLEALANSDYPNDKMIIVLSFEQRAGKERELVAREIEEEFRNRFFKLLITFHPSDLPDEIPGHGSNDAWAVAQAKERVIDPLKIPYENVVVSSFDIDTHVFPRYFSCLTYHYLTCKKPTRTSFQPIPLYNNNIWEAVSFSQVSSFSNTFWQIMCQERPESLVTFSSHSMSLKALVEVGFKQKNIIPDDSRVFWQCFFKYDGDYRVQPIFYPVSMDSNVGKNVIETLKQIYKQQKRWAYGVEDIPYFLYGCLQNKKIPFRKKLLRGAELIIGHWTWATASILIFALGWLPVFFAGSGYRESIIFYTIPKMASRIMTFAMLGMALSIWYSWLLLPSKPDKVGKMKYVGFLLAWLLIPIEMIFFNSFPAMEAQTRCMLGKYMGFWVTPKSRK